MTSYGVYIDLFIQIFAANKDIHFGGYVINPTTRISRCTVNKTFKKNQYTVWAKFGLLNITESLTYSCH